MTKVGGMIAVDWGSSNLRLDWLSDDGKVVASERSPTGVSQLEAGRIPQHLSQKIQALGLDAEQLPVFLCGMVGSNLGWHDAGYVDCPADLTTLSQRLVTVPDTKLRAKIVPGLRTQSPLGHPDVMRGEETQILGWLKHFAAANNCDTLLCLPGTHTKWVQLRGGKVDNFQSSFTGELFALLCRHSVLVSGAQQASATAFDEGSAVGLKSSALSQTLFATRSRVVGGDSPGAHAGSFLSGLLIGSEISSARALWEPEHVTLIGDPKLTQHYSRVLAQLNVTHQSHDGARLSARGLHYLYQSNSTT